MFKSSEMISSVFLCMKTGFSFCLILAALKLFSQAPTLNFVLSRISLAMVLLVEFDLRTILKLSPRSLLSFLNLIFSINLMSGT